MLVSTNLRSKTGYMMKKTKREKRFRKRDLIIFTLLICIALLSGCQTKDGDVQPISLGERIKGFFGQFIIESDMSLTERMKALFSHDETVDRIKILGYTQNVLAANYTWEDISLNNEWFKKTPKLTDKVEILNNYNGYTLYWREKENQEGFFKNLNEAAISGGCELYDSWKSFTGKEERIKYKYKIKEVYKEYSGWGNSEVTITIARSHAESDMVHNVSANYKMKWCKDEELTRQKEKEGLSE